MKKEIKLVAVDIDDTLLRDDLTISPNVKAAIKAAEAKGVMVTLATGRMFSSAVQVAAQLELDLPIITYQGGLIRFSRSKETIYHKPVARELAKELIASCGDKDVHLNVYANDKLYMADYTARGQYYAQLIGVPAYLARDWDTVLQQEPTKLLMIGDPDYLAVIQPEYQRLYGERIYVTKSKKRFLEFTNLEATKGRAIQVLADYLQIGIEQTMAIGDSFNDIEMIKAAGIGVAMGNAPEAVKEHAQFVTHTNEDDGVAEALREFVL